MLKKAQFYPRLDVDHHTAAEYVSTAAEFWSDRQSEHPSLR
jgi:hypothetical protein